MGLGVEGSLLKLFSLPVRGKVLGTVLEKVFGEISRFGYERVSERGACDLSPKP